MTTPRLAAVVSYAARMKLNSEQLDREGYLPYVDQATVARELVELVAVSPELPAADVRDLAALELALWAREWESRLGSFVVSGFVASELATLFLDRGVSEADAVASMVCVFRAVKAARPVAVHPDGG